MREPVVVEIGGRPFTIRPLTLGQVETIEAAVAAGKSAVATGLLILAAALSRDHTDVTATDLEGTAAELAAATNAILRMAFDMGETKSGTAGPGEDAAAAANASGAT